MFRKIKWLQLPADFRGNEILVAHLVDACTPLGERECVRQKQRERERERECVRERESERARDRQRDRERQREGERAGILGLKNQGFGVSGFGCRVQGFVGCIVHAACPRKGPRS